MRTLKIAIFSLMMLSFFNSATAIKTHTKARLTTAFTGSLSKDKKIKFYLEQELGLIDDKYKFQQTRLWIGIGYQLASNLVLFIGDAPYLNRNSKGVYSHGHIAWQQASWTIFDSVNYRLNTRSRTEEMKKNHESQWAMIFRQKLQLKIPLKNCERHVLLLSDEIFFGLKNPQWKENNSFISENKVYVGIGTQLSKEISFSIGYLNQYQFTHPNQMSNMLALDSEINFE